MLGRNGDFREKPIDISRLESNISSCLHDFIKENLAKGHSLDNIKAALVEYGFKEDLVSRLVRRYFIKNFFCNPFFVLIFVFVIGSLFLIRPAIIGYTSGRMDYNYTDTIDLALIEKGIRGWNLTDKEDPTSVKLSGTISGVGDANVHIEYDEDDLIVNISKCYISDLAQIKGSAVSYVLNSTVGDSFLSHDVDYDGLYSKCKVCDEFKGELKENEA